MRIWEGSTLYTGSDPYIQGIELGYRGLKLIAPLAERIITILISAGFGIWYVKREVKNNLNGEVAAKLVNKTFHEFVETVNSTDKVRVIIDEINKAAAIGIQNLKILENTKLLTDKIEVLLQALRETQIIKLLDGLREDLQVLLTNVARDATLKTAPWIVLGTGMVVGTPFAVSYIYRKAVHNIGKPNLATEVRYVGLYDRSIELFSNVMSGSWNSTKIGLKFGIGTATLSTALFIATNFVSLFKNGSMLTSKNMEEFGNVSLIASLGIAGAAAVSKAALLTYRHINGSYKKQDKPVFHQKLNDTLEQIIKSTYNLQSHGGFFQNLMLYGPGGTGKTMIAKFIARNSNNMNFVLMSGGDLAQYIGRGEHVTELNKLFESAKRSSAPTIIFIDEAESLCRNRDNIIKPELVELLNAFLNHTGESSNKIMLILATNRIEDLDPAVLNRMDYKLFIGPPRLKERKQMIENHLPSFFTQKEIKEFFPEDRVCSMALKTDGFTGRTVFKLLNSIHGSKNASNDNRLTKDMIANEIRNFIEREISAMEAVNARPKINT